MAHGTLSARLLNVSRRYYIVSIGKGLSLIAAQIMDECHETKSPKTGAMRHFWNNTRANEDCKSLFMSGTPWSQSPGELEGIFEVLMTNEWVTDNRLKHACDDNFKALVASYKRLLQRENQVETSPQLQKEMKETTNTLAGILELTGELYQIHRVAVCGITDCV